MTFETLNKTLAPYKKPGALVQLILLGAWVFTQYALGNKFYAVFIVILLLLLVTTRPPAFIFVAASVLVIVLFNTQTIETLTELRRSNLNTVRNIRPALRKAFSPNSGEDVLPVQVQQMLSLLRTHHISSYQVAGQFTSDPLIMQRIIESAWPIKLETSSPYFLIALAETNNNPACTLIDQREDVRLVFCP